MMQASASARATQPSTRTQTHNSVLGTICRTASSSVMAAGRVVVYGGKGALGSAVTAHFKENDWWVVSVDLVANEEAHANVLVTPTDSWTQQEQEVRTKLGEVLKDDKVDAIFCVAGGWAGGNAASVDLVKNADLMCKQSVWTSVISAGLASKHLKSGGLLVLTGAKPSLGSTSGMIGYGLAKAAVHQLVQSLADPQSGLPENSSVLGILPVTLDTPMNRKGMPNADFNQWTPLEFVASTFLQWTTGERPPSSSLLQLITTDGNTEIVPTATA